MAHLDGFDANNVEPSAPMQPIPAGTYLAMIVESTRKQTKSGTGEFLELKFQVQDGQYKGRTVIDRLNLWNQNQTAREISQGDMSAICRAVGVMTPNDSCDLHNVPLEIIVGVTNPNHENKVYNEIKGYQKRGAAAATQPVQQQPQQPPVEGQQQPNNWMQPQQ